MSELIFPPSERAKDQSTPYEFGPNTSPYASTNGLTYFYDDVSGSWTLKAGTAVTRDQLDAEMLEKLDKSGGTIYGSLSFRETLQSDDTQITFFKTGMVAFYKEGKIINFADTATQAAEVHVDYNTNDVDSSKVLSFAKQQLNLYKTLNFTSNAATPLIQHKLESNDDFIVMNLNGNNANYKGTNKIVIGGSNGLSFHIGTHNNPVLKIGAGNGKVRVRSKTNDQGTFRVQSASGEVIFDIDTKTYKIRTHAEYNQALIDVDHFHEESNEQVVYNEDNLVATMGFVRSGFFRPGMNVFADDEGDVEVGGFWKSNNNFYIRVE